MSNDFARFIDFARESVENWRANRSNRQDQQKNLRFPLLSGTLHTRHEAYE